MGKGFILNQRFESFVFEFSQSLLKEHIDSESEDRQPTTLYVKHRDKQAVMPEYENSHMKAADVPYQVEKKESYFVIHLDSAVELSRRSMNDLVDHMKTLGDFVFFDSYLFTRNSQYLQILEHDNIENIDGIIDSCNVKKLANVEKRKDENYLFHSDIKTYLFLDAEFDNTVIHTTKIRKNKIDFYYKPRVNTLPVHTEKITFDNQESLVVMGLYNYCTIKKFIFQITNDNSQELTTIDNNQDGVVIKPSVFGNFLSIPIIAAPVASALLLNYASTHYITGLAMLSVFMLIVSIPFALFYGFLFWINPKFKLLHTTEDYVDNEETLNPSDLSVINMNMLDMKDNDPSQLLSITQGPIKEYDANKDRQDWLDGFKSSYQDIYDSWMEYELNISKILQYPAMADISVPATNRFFKIKKQIQRIMKMDDLNIYNDRKNIDELLSKFEMSFLEAEQYAIKNKIGQYTLEDQKKLIDALPIAELAQSESATDDERFIASKALLKKIEGVIVLPEGSREILQRNLITSK